MRGGPAVVLTAFKVFSFEGRSRGGAELSIAEHLTGKSDPNRKVKNKAFSAVFLALAVSVKVAISPYRLVFSYAQAKASKDS